MALSVLSASNLSDQKYDADFALLAFKKMGEALKYCPENPSAWFALGLYLTLSHQPESAAIAHERAINAITVVG